jgi:hypothetical protein
MRVWYVNVQWDEGDAVLLAVPEAPWSGSSVADPPPSTEIWKWDDPTMHVRRYWTAGSAWQYISGTAGPRVFTCTRTRPPTTLQPGASLPLRVVSVILCVVGVLALALTLTPILVKDIRRDVARSKRRARSKGLSHAKQPRRATADERSAQAPIQT